MKMMSNPFRKPQVQHFEFGPESAKQIERLIKAVSDNPPIGETSVAQKLDAIIEMLRSQANVAADLALVKEELSIVHGLLDDLVNADPEKIKELAASVKAVREKLQTSVDNQTKET